MHVLDLPRPLLIGLETEGMAYVIRVFKPCAASHGLDRFMVSVLKAEDASHDIVTCISRARSFSG